MRRYKRKIKAKEQALHETKVRAIKRGAKDMPRSIVCLRLHPVNLNHREQARSQLAAIDCKVAGPSRKLGNSAIRGFGSHCLV